MTAHLTNIIAGIMSGRNEKKHNDDNSAVSNERIKWHLRESSWEIIMLLASFMTLIQDINTEER